MNQTNIKLMDLALVQEIFLRRLKIDNNVDPIYSCISKSQFENASKITNDTGHWKQ